MNVPTIAIDMTEPDLKKRFAPFVPYAAQVREAVDAMLREAISWGKPALVSAAVRSYAKFFINATMRREMKVIASLMDLPYHHLIMANCYWDGFCVALKTDNPYTDLKDMLIKKIPRFGCTAFSYDSPDGPVHGRNMDWFFEGHIKGLTAVVEYKGKLPENSYTTVSLTGLSAIISGMKPGAFSITLNAVTSDEKALGQPVGLLIRKTLEQARSFDEAVKMLSEEPILSDALLLVTGVRNGQLAVVERTPTKSAIRRAENGFIAVSNDYIAYNGGQSGGTGGEIEVTSCSRYKRVTELLARGFPKTTEEALGLLSDDGVKMQQMTVQQMVFCPATGFMDVHVPK